MTSRNTPTRTYLLLKILCEVITAKIDALDKRRCFRLRGGAFMRRVLDRGGPSGPYVVVLSER